MTTYNKLKTLMRSRGYTVSEGDDWLASDTPQYQAFATRELGVPYSRTTHMLAYPQAFPEAMALIEAMTWDEPVSVTAAVASTLPQAEPVAEPVAAPVVEPVVESDDEVLGLSGVGQAPKQDLDLGAQNAEQEAAQDQESGDDEQSDDSEEPPEQAEGDEHSGGEGQEQSEEEQPADKE